MPDRTHWDGCWREHHECAVAEVERVRRFAEAVCDNLQSLVDEIYRLTDDDEPRLTVIVPWERQGEGRRQLSPMERAIMDEVTHDEMTDRLAQLCWQWHDESGAPLEVRSYLRGLAAWLVAKGVQTPSAEERPA